MVLAQDRNAGVRRKTYRQGAHSHRGAASGGRAERQLRWRRPEPIIGRVEIDIRNIFDESDPRERQRAVSGSPNACTSAPNTRPFKAQLLFASGDKYSARKLAETERALRLLPYVYDAPVVPVRYADGKVDVRVITKDVWTLSPGMSFGRAGGTNSTKFNLQDSNFLGWGKTLQISHGQHRRSNQQHRGLERSERARFAMDFGRSPMSDSSDGYAARRCRSRIRSIHWILHGARRSPAIQFDRTISRYNLGNIVDQFNDNEASYELSGGISNGLIDGWTKRWTFGMRYDRSLFLPAPGHDGSRRRGCRRTNPVLPLHRIRHPPGQIQEGRRRESDRPRPRTCISAREVTGEVGIFDAAFSVRTAIAIMVTANAAARIRIGSRAADVSHQRFLVPHRAGPRAQFDRRRRRQVLLALAQDWLLYAACPGPSPTLWIPDMQLLLGGDNGLRGYPLRYESGTSRALFTVEQRVFTDWFPFRLVRVGGAVFADVGRTWGTGVVGNSDPGLLKDVGFGLRLGNTRSGLGNVLHIDFAFPAERCRRESKNSNFWCRRCKASKTLGPSRPCAAARRATRLPMHTAKFSTHHHSCRLLFLSVRPIRACGAIPACP